MGYTLKIFTDLFQKGAKLGALLRRKPGQQALSRLAPQWVLDMMKE